MLLGVVEQWASDRGLYDLRHHSPSNEEATSIWDALGFAVVERLRIRSL
jgi:hypothetical protein